MIMDIIQGLPYLVIGILIDTIYNLWKSKKLGNKKSEFQKKQLNIHIDALNRCLDYKRERHEKLVNQIYILNQQLIHAERSSHLSRKELITLAAKDMHDLRR